MPAAALLPELCPASARLTGPPSFPAPTCLQIALRTRYWTWINHLLIWLSIAIWWPFVIGYSAVFQVRS